MGHEFDLLLSSLKDLARDIKENEREQTLSIAEINNITKILEKLQKTVFEGNGKDSLMTRLGLIEMALKDLLEWKIIIDEHEKDLKKVRWQMIGAIIVAIISSLSIWLK